MTSRERNTDTNFDESLHEIGPGLPMPMASDRVKRQIEAMLAPTNPTATNEELKITVIDEPTVPLPSLSHGDQSSNGNSKKSASQNSSAHRRSGSLWRHAIDLRRRVTLHGCV